MTGVTGGSGTQVWVHPSPVLNIHLVLRKGEQQGPQYRPWSRFSLWWIPPVREWGMDIQSVQDNPR